MITRVIVLATWLLVLGQSVSAFAGRLPQSVPPDNVIDCSVVSASPQQPIIAHIGEMVIAEYCASSAAITLDKINTYQHTIYIDGIAFVMSPVQCQVITPGVPISCRSQLPPLAVAKLGDGKIHYVQVSFAENGVEGPRSIAFALDNLATSLPTPTAPTCTYLAPVAGAVEEQRPKGQMIQGFNPIGLAGTVNNQAARLAQLKAWGWRPVLSQFADGTVRLDKTDRLFLIVECVGLSQ